MNKKFFFFFVLLTLFSPFLYSADWVLGGTAFTFTQKETRPSSLEAKGALLPSLILEQISDSSYRMTTDEEMLSRTLSSFSLERQSLFLQLSKEVKTRDSYILSETSQRTLKKKLASQNEKISGLKKQIQENLEKTDRATKEAEERIKKRKEEVSEGVNRQGFFIRAFNPF
ncbi:MAG: hypothetical protein J5780_00375, partial [Treponema sp.]|nr:hypothetical protein [Treponema sp.]